MFLWDTLCSSAVPPPAPPPGIPGAALGTSTLPGRTCVPGAAAGGGRGSAFPREEKARPLPHPSPFPQLPRGGRGGHNETQPLPPPTSSLSLQQELGLQLPYRPRRTYKPAQFRPCGGRGPDGHSIPPRLPPIHPRAPSPHPMELALGSRGNKRTPGEMPGQIQDLSWEKAQETHKGLHTGLPHSHPGGQANHLPHHRSFPREMITHVHTKTWAHVFRAAWLTQNSENAGTSLMPIYW